MRSAPGVRRVVTESVTVHEQDNRNRWAPGSLLASLPPREQNVALALGRPRQYNGGYAPWLPLAVAAVAAVVWIALWLYLVAGAVLWAAVAVGLALTAAIVAALVSCLYPATSKARRLLDGHSRRWNEAAHRYGATLEDGSPAADALARLLTGEENPSLDGIGTFDALILSALRKYNPAGLAESLDSTAIPVIRKDLTGKGD